MIDKEVAGAMINYRNIQAREAADSMKTYGDNLERAAKERADIIALKLEKEKKKY